MGSAIIRFTGPNDFLSNFAAASISMDGVLYPTVENAYQAAKTLCAEERVQFAQCAPNYAKKLGRSVTLRGDWEQVKDSIMLGLLRQKFSPGTVYARRLLFTADAYLCEGNTWHDNHFGACFCERCLYVGHRNLLGNMLMQIRRELQ